MGFVLLVISKEMNLSELETDLKLFSNLIHEMKTFITLHNQYSTKDSVPSNSSRIQLTDEIKQCVSIYY